MYTLENIYLFCEKSMFSMYLTFDFDIFIRYQYSATSLGAKFQKAASF